MVLLLGKSCYSLLPMKNRDSLLSGLDYKMIYKQLSFPANRFKIAFPNNRDRLFLAMTTEEKSTPPSTFLPSTSLPFQKLLLLSQSHLASKAMCISPPFLQTFYQLNYQWQSLFVLGLINYPQNRHQHYSDW